MWRVIEGGAMRAPEPQGLSDQQRGDEAKAQALVLPAVAALRSACQDAALLSDVMREDIEALLDALDDYGLSERIWVERLAELDQATRTSSYRRGVA